MAVQVGLDVARLTKLLNQNGIEIAKYEPVITFTEGLKLTVLVDTAPFMSEELLQLQLVREEAE